MSIQWQSAIANVVYGQKALQNICVLQQKDTHTALGIKKWQKNIQFGWTIPLRKRQTEQLVYRKFCVSYITST